MYRRGAKGWLKHLDFIILDLACLQLSFVLAYMVRSGPYSPYREEAYRSIGVVLFLADVAVVFLTGTFKNVLKRGYYREFAVTIKQVCLVEAAAIAYLFTIQQSITYSRFIIYLMAVLYIGSSFFTRCFWKRHLFKKLAAANRKRSLLIITVKDLAEEVLANVATNNFDRFHIAGIAVLDADLQGEEICGVPVVAGAENVADFACRIWVDEVLINLPHNTFYPQELVSQFAQMGIVVHIGLFRAEADSGSKQFVERLGNYTVLTASINYATPLQQLLKRSMDIAGGIVGCLATGVLLLFLAPPILILSPGPVFFTQERVGMNGKRFRIYKFRSMYMDAEKRKKELMEQNRCGDGMMFKMEGDPRIIGCKILPDGTMKKGLGNYMRDWSLDEFPQFFNVLKGDMSLVGTRPPTVDEWERYKPHHRARLAVRPGITGLWQVSGRSNIRDFEEVVKLDTKYIMEWSMGLDLRILLRTVKAVFGKEGAM